VPSLGGLGLADLRALETLSYTAAAGQPGFVSNDAGRIYKITSDPGPSAVPEPDYMVLLAGITGAVIISRCRRLLDTKRPKSTMLES
jgi:hypothetical protein